jgi:1,4-dihydroxy-2-naphthoate octaprenyltransferase
MTGPIGGVAPSAAANTAAVLGDVGHGPGLAVALGLYHRALFRAGLAGYILASRAYSYRGIRLKKYPFAGWLTVITCQGALVFFLVYQGSHPAGAGVASLQAPVKR